MTRSNKKLKSDGRAAPDSGIRAISGAPVQPVLLLILSAALLLSSCSPLPTSEQIVDDFLSRCEAALEKRSNRELRNLIAEEYIDSKGRTKRDIAGIAAGYILGNKAIYCYRLIKSINVNDDGSISAKLLAALAAQPLTDISRLPAINSDIYWFDITIAEEGKKWKLAEASWQQALLEDFFQ